MGDRSSDGERPSPSITARHYCQGIGDCHLLRFERADGTACFMLIDCGVHSSVTGGSETIARIVADIATVTKTIDVLVITHEHWDHVSGFLTAAPAFAGLTIGEVWMGWTENPADPQARQLDRFKQQARQALSVAADRLDLAAADLSPHLEAVRSGLSKLRGFDFGAKGERVRSARDAGADLATKGIRYLEPGGSTSLPGVDGFQVFVLGPPRDAARLRITDRIDEMYGLAGPRDGTSAPGPGDGGAPFDPRVGTSLSSILYATDAAEGVDPAIAAFVHSYYSGPQRTDTVTKARSNRRTKIAGVDQSWRRIDFDWLAFSAELAMQLDDRTNNTSVVLAFEFPGSRRVALFAADAQIGSWISWQDLRWQEGDRLVTGPDLLARTVFYKVGHHGSRNATAREKGLGLMTSPDLAAFIPTNEADAKKVGWGEMPHRGIMEDLLVKTQGRTVRADDAWLRGPTLDPRFAKPGGSLRRTAHDGEGGLWVEFEIA